MSSFNLLQELFKIGQASEFNAKQITSTVSKLLDRLQGVVTGGETIGHDALTSPIKFFSYLQANQVKVNNQLIIMTIPELQAAEQAGNQELTKLYKKVGDYYIQPQSYSYYLRLLSQTAKTDLLFQKLVSDLIQQSNQLGLMENTPEEKQALPVESTPGAKKTSPTSNKEVSQTTNNPPTSTPGSAQWTSPFTNDNEVDLARIDRFMNFLKEAGNRQVVTNPENVIANFIQQLDVFNTQTNRQVSPRIPLGSASANEASKTLENTTFHPLVNAPLLATQKEMANICQTLERIVGIAIEGLILFRDSPKMQDQKEVISQLLQLGEQRRDRLQQISMAFSDNFNANQSLQTKR